MGEQWTDERDVGRFEGEALARGVSVAQLSRRAQCFCLRSTEQKTMHTALLRALRSISRARTPARAARRMRSSKRERERLHRRGCGQLATIAPDPVHRSMQLAFSGRCLSFTQPYAAPIDQR